MSYLAVGLGIAEAYKATLKESCPSDKTCPEPVERRRRQSMPEFKPKLAMYGTTIAVALLTLWVTNLFPFALLVIGLAVGGFIGCYVSTLPLFEYMGAVMASIAMAMVIPLEPWIVVIPGLVTGYIWGNVVSYYFEHRHIDVLRAQSKKARDTRKTKKTTSF
jgi:hypothetical protein